MQLCILYYNTMSCFLIDSELNSQALLLKTYFCFYESIEIVWFMKVSVVDGVYLWDVQTHTHTHTYTYTYTHTHTCTHTQSID